MSFREKIHNNQNNSVHSLTSASTLFTPEIGIKKRTSLFYNKFDQIHLATLLQ